MPFSLGFLGGLLGVGYDTAGGVQQQQIAQTQQNVYGQQNNNYNFWATHTTYVPATLDYATLQQAFNRVAGVTETPKVIKVKRTKRNLPDWF